MAEIAVPRADARAETTDADLPRSWFRVLRAVANPRLRLICFPHAGGTAGFFWPWTGHVPEDVELLAVRYPGREDRLRDRAARNMEELAGPLAKSVAALDHAPFAFFGHSMGSLIAFETALRLEEAGGPVPEVLFVSGHSGPGADGSQVPADASDQEILDDLVQLGGVDAAVLESPELCGLVVDAVRADYRLMESYHPSPTRTVERPIVAYYGVEDDLDDDPVARWSRATSGEFGSRSFEGGHFYLIDEISVLVSDIVGRLERG